MNTTGNIVSGLVFLVVGLVIVFLIFLLIRAIVLWYFRIDRIVVLLEQIENNTRAAANATRKHVGDENIDVGDEEEFYSKNDVRVTNKRLTIASNEWPIDKFRPVQVERHKEKFRINLLDKTGQQVHYLESENQLRINLIAKAINTAMES